MGCTAPGREPSFSRTWRLGRGGQPLAALPGFVSLDAFFADLTGNTGLRTREVQRQGVQAEVAACQLVSLWPGDGGFVLRRVCREPLIDVAIRRAGGRGGAGV